MFRNIREGISAAKKFDPACTGAVSAVLHYPGLHALWAHRFDHWLWRHKLHFIARCGSQCARFLTGIEIHPGATIGRRFFIDHGMGIVIGETTIIGDDVMLYQGVTLGGTGKETGKRHPTLEDGVVVGVGAAVLGDITIGKHSKVGGGAVVVKDVPADCTVVGIPGKIVRKEGKLVACADLEDAPQPRPHEDLPDPVLGVLEDALRRITQLEKERDR